MPEIKTKKSEEEKGKYISNEDVAELFSMPLEKMYTEYADRPGPLGKAVASWFVEMLDKPDEDPINKQLEDEVEKKEAAAFLYTVFSFATVSASSTEYFILARNPLRGMLMATQKNGVVSNVKDTISLFNEAYKTAKKVIKEGSLINDAAIYLLEGINTTVQAISSMFSEALNFDAALYEAVRRGEDMPTFSDNDLEERLAKATNPNELENANKKLIAKYGENFKQVTTWFGTLVDELVAQMLIKAGVISDEDYQIIKEIYTRRRS
jgi:hypothetical protein